MIIQNINGMENGHSFVDLGLPSGLLWATCNVGADSPEQAGLYFTGDEVKGYTAEQVADGERKFDYQSYNNQLLRSTLAPQEDAAHANMGGKWRMPTKEEFQELIDNCTSVWVDDFDGTGMTGRLFTSKKNRNTIFFPAAGFGQDSSVCDVYSDGLYWSTSWYSTSRSWYLEFDRMYAGMSNYQRYYGQSVRGVCES